MTSNRMVNGVDLDNWFDPYISGTQPAATGYQVAGVDLNQRYAPLYLGVQAALTGYAVNGADLNTLFAKIGTAQYLLPINGVKYSALTSTAPKAGGIATVSFGFSSATEYFIGVSSAAPPAPPRYSFAVPAGMAQVRLTLTLGSESITASTENTATVLTPISTNVAAYVSISTAAIGTNVADYTLKVEFADASGNVVWTGTCTLFCEVYVPS